jgi:hypothetical protein
MVSFVAHDGWAQEPLFGMVRLDLPHMRSIAKPTRVITPVSHCAFGWRLGRVTPLLTRVITDPHPVTKKLSKSIHSCRSRHGLHIHAAWGATDRITSAPFLFTGSTSHDTQFQAGRIDPKVSSIGRPSIIRAKPPMAHQLL